MLQNVPMPQLKRLYCVPKQARMTRAFLIRKIKNLGLSPYSKIIEDEKEDETTFDDLMNIHYGTLMRLSKIPKSRGLTKELLVKQIINKGMSQWLVQQHRQPQL